MKLHDELLDALGGIDDDLLPDLSGQPRGTNRRNRILRWTAAAAVVCLLAGGGILIGRMAAPAAVIPVTVTLPQATMVDSAPATEDVYDFTLEFNDGTVQTAKLGLISGIGDGRGSTRCLSPASGAVWEKVSGQVAIPIPYGMTSFEINGTPTHTGLGGDQGWYAFKLKSGVTATLSGLVDEDIWTAALKGAAAGFFLIVR